MVLYVYFLFFFFKQKTAYEMRISDWSSDVCSSDLHPGVAQGRLPPRDHELHRCARRRGQDVQLQDQRAAAPRPRAEAVRGPEGLDQADQPGVDGGDRKSVV